MKISGNITAESITGKFWNDPFVIPHEGTFSWELHNGGRSFKGRYADVNFWNGNRWDDISGSYRWMGLGGSGRMQLVQNGKKITGQYDYDGWPFYPPSYIEGEIDGFVIRGKWSEKSGKKTGRVEWIITSDSHFEGKYSRSSDQSPNWDQGYFWNLFR